MTFQVRHSDPKRKVKSLEPAAGETHLKKNVVRNYGIVVDCHPNSPLGLWLQEQGIFCGYTVCSDLLNPPISTRAGKLMVGFNQPDQTIQVGGVRILHAVGRLSQLAD